jgi:pimeloyl-ACP methyl ester carboxylesterase
MENIKIEGIQIAFERKGSGHPLVLLHGALSDSRMWQRQIEYFSKKFTVVAWDAPGCGQSSDPPEDFSLADYADTLNSLINTLNLEKPHVLGLSFGGGLALEYYHRFPEVPKTLLLASAYAGWAGSLPPEEVENRVKNGIQQSELPPEKVVEKWIPTLFSESVTPDAIHETASVMSEFHPVGMRAMLKAFAKADLRYILPQIKIPSLLIYGDADERSPLNLARELHKNIPASTLVTLPGVGHVANIEAPEIFNREVYRFLKSH